MQLFTDGLIAVLASFGLASVMYLTLKALLFPRLPDWRDAAVLVPASGGAQSLTETVRQLERIRHEERAFSRIVIVDCGMDAEALRRAQLLCRGNYGIELCSRTALFASPEE